MSQAQHTEWHWPLDLTRYDRAPQLHPQEQAALERFAARSAHAAWFAPIQVALPRLITPLCDALQVLAARARVRTAVVAVVLTRKHRDQTTYWAIPESEWARFLQSDWQDYTSDPANTPRYFLASALYLLRCFSRVATIPGFQATALATRLFGCRFESALTRVSDSLRRVGYSDFCATDAYLPLAVGQVLLSIRSPALEEITVEVLERLYQGSSSGNHRGALSRLSYALFALQLIQRPLDRVPRGSTPLADTVAGIHAEWVEWCQRWVNTSTLSPDTRQGLYRQLLRVGRWLALTHPHVSSPEHWTRELAADCVAAVERLHVGAWHHQRPLPETRPLTPAAKDRYLQAVRTFFHDCQGWGWIPRRFDPQRSFVTPRSILAALQPDPRVIADPVWAKLLWAGLNLSADDLATVRAREGVGPPYPIEMVRAVALTWLFAGLRVNEIRRLRVGCIRWQAGADRDGSEEACPEPVYLLHVPVNKTGVAFVKPVDPVVGRAIEAWQTVRPPSPPRLDPKTSEVVQLLFTHRGVPLGRAYLNETLIPLLCEKAGVPVEDARGRLTSHRARATIASQLYNAPEGMSPAELQAWLGHRTPQTTQYYVQVTPTKQAQAYAAAGELARTQRLIEVLIDQDAIRSGAAQEDQPWRFYDLGDGLCSYDLFDQCPHRLACARCAFYVPKRSSRAQFLEAQANLQHLLQAITLTESEQAAVEEGVLVMAKLATQLQDVPTPVGPTPRELTGAETIEGG
ncbi:MAG TPA: transposase [Chloroflexi bacterium]|nr:transposase [Chloroflexota bacterium]